MANTVTTTHVWPLNTWKVASASEELNIGLYLILINLNVKSHLWLVAAPLDTADFDYFISDS